jgi:hypothetical protein
VAQTDGHDYTVATTMMPALDLDPVHTRWVTVVVTPLPDGRRELSGRIVDLRHRGTTWVGSLATRPGVVHDMSARLLVDGDGRIFEAGGGMRRAPFDGGAETGHAGCRDILGNVAGLANAVAGEDFGGRVTSSIGGRLGCYHLTTLVRAMEPVAVRAAIARRVVRVDGWRRAQSEVVIRARLEDEIGAETGEMPGSETAALDLTVGLEHSLQIREVRAVHRLGSDDGRSGRGCVRAADTARALSERRLLPGLGRELTAIAANGGCAPVVDAAFIVNAVASQILLHLARPETIAADPQTPRRAVDTCVMWRQNGPLQGLAVAYEAG